MSWSTWPVDENTLRATGPHAWMLALMEESQARRERRPYAFDGLEKMVRCPTYVVELIGTMYGQCEGVFLSPAYFGASCECCGDASEPFGWDGETWRGSQGGVVAVLYSPENRDGRALCAACIAGGK